MSQIEKFSALQRRGNFSISRSIYDLLECAVFSRYILSLCLSQLQYMPQYEVNCRAQLNKRYTLISDAAIRHHYIHQRCYHRDQMQIKPWAVIEALTYVTNMRTLEAIGELTANCRVTDRYLSGLATAKFHI